MVHASAIFLEKHHILPSEFFQKSYAEQKFNSAFLYAVEELIEDEKGGN